jgi:NDP-sugar pyrophosphorylase family protein
MGTAGCLALLPDRPSEPFFIMNGDILTSVNFGQILQFHCDNGAVASMAVHEHAMQVPYGVVEVQNHELVKITEKPVQNYFVNAGIYLLDPETVDRIPTEKPYDMPELFQSLLRDGRKIIAFPIWEYWRDIGHPSDLQRAEQEFPAVFGSA